MVKTIGTSLYKNKKDKYFTLEIYSNIKNVMLKVKKELNSMKIVFYLKKQKNRKYGQYRISNKEYSKTKLLKIKKDILFKFGD